MIDVIATIGPSSINYLTLKRMKRAGMTIARVNMKYSSVSQLLDIKKNLDKLGLKLLVDVLNLKQAESVSDVEFNYIALAFTESAGQVSELRKLFNKGVRVIAKIENKRGVKNIKSIIRASDGLMVARGDLSKNVKLEELPIYQKRIINECNAKSKYVITATEMLLSMVDNLKPTKAEVSDVANAVIDGSNALMLSEETAVGRHPVEAVSVMRRVINASVKYLNSLKGGELIES